MPKAFSPQDHYFHLAKKRGLRARSAFKLEEILEKFPRLLRKGQNVLDLGAAPGSFLQVLGEKVGSSGRVMGIDLQSIETFSKFPAELSLLQHDIFAKDIGKKIREIFPKGVDVITSDLAPKTSGISDVDQWKSIELCHRVLDLTQETLKPGGNLILKIFVGADFQNFRKNEFEPQFQRIHSYKPKASRDRSFETYLIGEKFTPIQR